MSVAVLAERRASNGRFAPGHSGNPAGRPKGARNRTTLLAEALLDGEGEALCRKAIDRALAGDTAMARFLIGRLCPASADQPVALGLAPGEEKDPDAVLTRTLRLVADGEITPKQGLQIARFVAILARLRHEARKVSRRLAEQSGHRPGRAAKEKARIPAARKPQGPLAPPPAGAREGSEAPVSALYFSDSPAARRRPERPLAGLGLRAGEDAPAPVSNLYFSAPDASRVALRSTTAIGLAARMAASREAGSPRAGLPI